MKVNFWFLELNQNQRLFWRHFFMTLSAGIFLFPLTSMATILPFAKINQEVLVSICKNR